MDTYDQQMPASQPTQEEVNAAVARESALAQQQMIDFQQNRIVQLAVQVARLERDLAAARAEVERATDPANHPAT